MLKRPDVVCSYPTVSGELDFWAACDIVESGVYVGDAVENGKLFDRPLLPGGNVKAWAPYIMMNEWRAINGRGLDYNDSFWVKYFIYPPQVRCSRISFIGGLGYETDHSALPASEHPEQEGPIPSADAFLGWYGFDASHRRDPPVEMYDDTEYGDVFKEEGWGRPAFEFTPLAAHADQSWAYAPATRTRQYDTVPEHGTTEIKKGSFAYEVHDVGGSTWIHAGLPPKDIYIRNWFLLAMIGGDPWHGPTKPTEQNPNPGPGKVTPLYWNTESIRQLTCFGDVGQWDFKKALFETILWRIYAKHCKTADMTPGYGGIQFPPGFLVDVRIIAETYECSVTQDLLEDAFQNPHYLTFSENGGGRTPPGQVPRRTYLKIYMGTHFSVLYRCAFPIWRNKAAS